MYKIRYKIAVLLVCLYGLSVSAQDEPKHHWNNHAQVARQAIKKFEELNSIRGDFTIVSTDSGRSRNMSGRYYFQKPNKIRYEFRNPAGNLIVSNGKTMWYFIRRKNIVGRQDLTIKKKNSSGRDIFVSGVVSGLKRLFKKYHYHFDNPEQPRNIDGKEQFVLSMKQRTRIGGYETMILYVDAKTYLVTKASGEDGYGKKSTISFSNITINPSLEGKLFQYSPDNRVRVVKNPFVKDDPVTTSEGAE